ncbi:MAG: hypothetical protein KA314_08765 [Chloroflexi bacterium]|nr:hypothetical protein [Chloroflexota bacterium]MBP8055920.1 hypothetical protein [Chloroflexota bacterium]
MAQIRLLYRLQEMDNDIRVKKQRLGEVLRLQKEDETVKKARAEAAAAASQREHWQKQRRKLETEIADLENKTKQASDRLYSGVVKNPKELADLQHQIEAMSRHHATLEDTLLETMLEVEEAEKEYAAAAATQQQVETTWEKNNTGLRHEQEQLALHLHDLLGRRQEMSKLIKPGDLTLYDQLAKKQGGVAVAQVQYNMCGVCRVTVSAQKIKSAQEGELVYCGSCGRILYAP